jgi:hypothetical protein
VRRIRDRLPGIPKLGEARATNREATYVMGPVRIVKVEALERLFRVCFRVDDG